MLLGLIFLNNQCIKGKKASFICVKAKRILWGVTILMLPSAQASFANTPLQGMQFGDKGINDPHTKGCPGRLLSDSRSSTNIDVPYGDAKTGCPRRHIPHNMLDNLTASQIPSASFEQRSCQILIFVSFSMPEISLKSLAQEVAREPTTPCRPVLVMQGLYQDSFAKTAEKLKNLGVSVDINPELFDAHQVTVVPTFILVKDSKPLHCLKGNVTLAFAREAFTQQGTKALAEERMTP